MTPAEYNKRLPNPGYYAAEWRKLLAMDPKSEISVPGFIVGMSGWGRQTERVEHVLRCIRFAMQWRINARAGFTPRTSREGDVPLYRDARAVQAILTTRLRVYQFETATARRRFGHLLAKRDD